jgi:hypothetical protein
MKRSVPIRPAAPGWLSITICWPVFSAIFWVTMRIPTSIELPACSGMIIRIDLPA